MSYLVVFVLIVPTFVGLIFIAPLVEVYSMNIENNV